MLGVQRQTGSAAGAKVANTSGTGMKRTTESSGRAAGD